MKIVVMMLAAALAAMGDASLAAAAGAPRCEAGEPAQQAQDKAIGAVAALPEVVALREALEEPLRVAFTNLAHELVAGRCGVSVPVYVDHPDRFELRATFFVDDTTGEVLDALDPVSGDYLPLASWRASQHLD